MVFKVILVFVGLMFSASDVLALETPGVPPLNPDSGFTVKQDSLDWTTAQLYCQTRNFISGSWGRMIGLLIAMFGLYSYLLQRSGYGIFFLIAGVGLTALPAIFDWYYRGVVVAFGSNSDGSVLGMTGQKITLERWCSSEYVRMSQTEPSGTLQRERDLDSERGLGLNSIQPEGYYCNAPISYDEDTNTYTSLPEELCNK